MVFYEFVGWLVFFGFLFWVFFLGRWRFIEGESFSYVRGFGVGWFFFRMVFVIWEFSSVFFYGGEGSLR